MLQRVCTRDCGPHRTRDLWIPLQRCTSLGVSADFDLVRIQQPLREHQNEYVRMLPRIECTSKLTRLFDFADGQQISEWQFLAPGKKTAWFQPNVLNHIQNLVHLLLSVRSNVLIIGTFANHSWLQVFQNEIVHASLSGVCVLPFEVFVDFRSGLVFLWVPMTVDLILSR